jgi:hypothetical protein
MNIVVKRYETKADAATIKLDGVTEDGKRQVRFSLPKTGEMEKLVRGITNVLRTRHLVFQLTDGEWEIGARPVHTKASNDAPLVVKEWHDRPIFPLRPVVANAGWNVDVTRLPAKEGAAPAPAEAAAFLAQFAQQDEEEVEEG